MMKLTEEIEITRSTPSVWAAITNIEHCQDMISNIIALKILYRPEQGLVGLKWQETRMMFGKQATETMWITEAVENAYYCTRAESHGCVYISTLSLRDQGEKTILSMSFKGEAQTILTKMISAMMGLFVTRSMKKILRQDLQDIKRFIEQS